MDLFKLAVETTAAIGQAGHEIMAADGASVEVMLPEEIAQTNAFVVPFRHDGVRYKARIVGLVVERAQ